MKIVGIKTTKLRLVGALLFIAFLIAFTAYFLNFHLKYLNSNLLVSLIISIIIYIPFIYYRIKISYYYWSLNGEKLIYMHPEHFTEVFKNLIGNYHGTEIDVKDIKSIEFYIVHGLVTHGFDTYGIELHVNYDNRLVILPMNVDYKQRLVMLKFIDKLSELNPNIRIIDNFKIMQYLKYEDIYQILRDKFNNRKQLTIKQR